MAAEVVAGVRRAVALRTRLRALAPRIAGARSRLARGESGVAITFDDGPEPEHTARILDVLAERGARATFFCVGDAVRAHPDLVRRMVADGHRVGSHSQRHLHSRELRLVDRVREFRAGRRELEEVVGHRVRLFRPPHGDIDFATAVAIRVAGLRCWLWSVDPGDWRPDARAAAISNDVARARSGDVVLLHDAISDPVAPAASDRSQTVAALPAILDRLAADRLETVLLPIS